MGNLGIEFEFNDFERRELRQFAEHSESKHSSAGLTPAKLANRLRLAGSAFNRMVACIRESQRVELPECPDLTLPPMGEMLALAIAMTTLNVRTSSDNAQSDEELWHAWFCRCVKDRRCALEGALVELAKLGIWGPRSAIDCAPVPVDQVSVVFAPRPSLSSGNAFLAQEASVRGPFLERISKKLGPNRALNWLPGDCQARPLHLALEAQAAILVMHWEAPPIPGQPRQHGPLLGLGPGNQQPHVDSDILVAMILEGLKSAQCRAIELAVCHGSHLATLWKASLGAVVFGFPGLRSEGLLLESIAELVDPVRARKIFGDALEQVYAKPFFVVRQIFHAMSAVPRYYSDDNESEESSFDAHYTNLF